MNFQPETLSMKCEVALPFLVLPVNYTETEMPGS